MPYLANDVIEMKLGGDFTVKTLKRWAIAILALVTLGTATINTLALPVLHEASSTTTVTQPVPESGVPWQS